MKSQYLKILADPASELWADVMLNVALLMQSLLHRRRTLMYVQLAFCARPGIATRKACQGKGPRITTNM